MSVQIKNQVETKKVLGTKIAREEEIKRLSKLRDYWEGVASSSPTFRDGWVQLSVISSQLASTQEAKLYLQRALEIDPNWVVPDQLQPLLQ